MIDRQEMNRILYRHEWHSLEEWGRTLNDLASMNEDEIGEIVHAEDAQRLVA